MTLAKRKAVIVVSLALVGFAFDSSCDACWRDFRCPRVRTGRCRANRAWCARPLHTASSATVKLIDVEWSQRMVGDADWEVLPEKFVLWHDFIPWEYRWRPIFDTKPSVPIARIDMLFYESPNGDWTVIATSKCSPLAVGQLPLNENRTEFWWRIRVRLADGTVLTCPE